MSIAAQPSAEALVCLHNVPWKMYEALRDELENRNVRMTYDRGWLQLMCPSKLHERLGNLLGRLIEAWTEQAGIEVQNCRCMTLRRLEQERGLEPNNCFYIEHEPAVRGRDELDLERDPPPDLAVEIGVASSSGGRMEIYAAVGVPEVWRWKDGGIEVYRLDRRGRY
ncbi:MAG TPA: Uma2 family endonuclease, partial [Pirellulales bacterium]|nr:Uma2 family endonuclease [Pirellulales bacterium]